MAMDVHSFFCAFDFAAPFVFSTMLVSSFISNNLVIETVSQSNLSKTAPSQYADDAATASNEDSVSTSTSGVNYSSSAIASNAEQATLTPTDQAGVYLASDGRQVIKCDEVLTSTDKALFTSLNGGTLDSKNSSLMHLKTDIALSRVNGMLTGDVTPKYISDLIENQNETTVLNQQQAAIYAQEGETSLAQAYSSFTPSISSDLLQKALTYLTNH